MSNATTTKKEKAEKGQPKNEAFEEDLSGEKVAWEDLGLRSDISSVWVEGERFSPVDLCFPNTLSGDSAEAALGGGKGMEGLVRMPKMLTTERTGGPSSFDPESGEYRVGVLEESERRGVPSKAVVQRHKKILRALTRRLIRDCEGIVVVGGIQRKKENVDLRSDPMPF